MTEVVVNGNLKKGKSISEIIQIVRDLRDIGIFKAPPQMGTLNLIFESMRHSSPALPASPPEVNPREIFPYLDKYPCAGELVKQLPSLNNDIAKLVQQTFQDRMGKKEQYDIAFFADETMSENLDGLCEMKYKSKGGDTLRFEITLNGKMLKTATKEYILGTMYHEVLHAYLDVERERLGKTKFENKYPNVYIHYMTGMYKGKAYSKTQFLLDNPIKTDNHHFKFASFISKIADAIGSYNPKISREIAYAIARTGIVRHSEMFIWEQRLNQNEREGNSESQGTKCN
ncbi:MAG: hypothetical protein Q4A09_03545 [Capnocytophaga felis]|nr:hypothetical protein [Capnocytophaga felis]